MPDNIKKVTINFKKASSLLRKVEQMTQEKEYCIDIMQQNLAVIGMLKSAHQMLMANHLNNCFTNAMATENKSLKRKMVEEILKVSNLVHKA